MNKLLLMASMAMMIVLPLRAARLTDPQRGLKYAVGLTLIFNAAWAVVVLAVFLYLLRNPALLFPESVTP